MGKRASKQMWESHYAPISFISKAEVYVNIWLHVNSLASTECNRHKTIC